MGILNDIGVKYGTDKSTLYHGYLDFYEAVFNSVGYTRESYVELIEIGVKDGSSIRMWKEYFTLSDIVGVDINPVNYIENCILITADAYSSNLMYFLFSKDYRVDIVVEDGSHKSKDVISTFEAWADYYYGNEFGKGVFVYEDCHCSFLGDYTPEGTVNAYDYIKSTCEEQGWDVYEYWKNPDNRADSGTLIVSVNKD